MNKIKIFIILILGFVLTCCDDMFEPAIENIRDKSVIYDEAGFADGLLTNGYLRLPVNNYHFSEYATDDAVTNDNSNDYLLMATGQWSASFNPTEQWQALYNAILYMNIVIAEADKVNWAKDQEVAMMFNDRIKGEAYGLRGLFMYYLMQAHAGWVNGELLGIPVIIDPMDTDSELNLPRDGFNACMAQIFSDLDMAAELLPVEYDGLNINDGQVPKKYEGISVSKYNRVFGTNFRGRMSGRIAMSVKAQAALLAASPAYAAGSEYTMEHAAQCAAQVLELNNGISGIDPNGHTWYTNLDEIQSLSAGSTPPEIIWRTNTRQESTGDINNTIEKSHFPPSLQGDGRCNPTQNLVDAFPMANGYPINNSNSGFDPSNPYQNRDPRLETYIVFHGSTAGHSNSVIDIETGINSVNNELGKSTRTGYYMRKLLRQAVNLNRSNPITVTYYNARIRYTEIYLIYAEAANEAYGPDGSAPGVSYSARDVIRAIRNRANVGGGNDVYLQLVASKEDMRELIRNERRIELCFEGHRFWDLRRWKVSLEKLNEPAMGIRINDGNVSEPIVVEERQYQDYMYHGPIPLSEILKWSNLKQNDGWR